MDLTQLKTESPLITGFAESRIGGRAENQDSFGWADTPFGFLVTVCDGMGGGPGGKTASSIAVKEIIAGVQEADPQEKLSNILIKAIRRANMAIISVGNEQPTLQGMGSTCTVLLINSQSANIAYVGDSRVYQLRRKQKIFRTFDHSMVFDLVRQKVITEEQARLSAQSNVITRALGIKPDVEVEITERPYERGDRFLLCTDGIHGAVEEKKLIQMASNRKIVLGNVVDEITTEIDDIGRNGGGGHDNLTLAIVETKLNSILQEKMSKKIKQLILAISTFCIISIALNIYLAINMENKSEAVVNKSHVDDSSAVESNSFADLGLMNIDQDTLVFTQTFVNAMQQAKNMVIKDGDTVYTQTREEIKEIKKLLEGKN